MMRDLKVGHLFSITRCADETRSKPHPLMLHEILNAMSVAAHEALMVGDTSFDLDMASAAEMPSLAMSHGAHDVRSEEHTSELQSRPHLVCRLLLEKKKKTHTNTQ